MTFPSGQGPAGLTLPLVALLVLGGVSPAREAPAWVNTLPTRPGRVYGVGGAALGTSGADALDRAAQNAKIQVVGFLGSGLRGRLSYSDLLRERRSSNHATFFSREAATMDATELDVSATDLPGLVVVERFLDRSGNTAYALVYLDCSVAERVLAERVHLLRAAVTDLLCQPPGSGLQTAIPRLAGIRSLRSRCRRLTDQAALLQATGLPPAIPAELQRLADDLYRAAAGLRPALTLGAPAQREGLAAEIQAILRETAVRLGYAWSGESPAMPLRIEIHAGQERSEGPLVPYPANPDDPELVGLRATVRISLLDAGGTVQDGFDIPVRGIGVDEASALGALEQTLHRELPVRFQAFLEQAR